MTRLALSAFAAQATLLTAVSSLFASPFGGIAPDGDQTLAWVREVNDKYLEYHCRIRFGDDPTQLKSSSNLNSERWSEIGKTLSRVEGRTSASPWNEIDNNLINLYRMRREYELLVQQKERQLADQMGFLAIRFIAEDMGGDDVKQIYEMMPDDWDVKQDIPGVASDWIQAGWTVQHFAQALSKLEQRVEQSILSRGGAHADRLMAELHRIENSQAVATHEKQWLVENRPALLDQLNIKAGAKIRDIHSRLDLIAIPDRLEAMRTFGRSQARRFLYHWDQSHAYEKQDLLSLAANELESAEKAFWPGFRDAMLAKADAMNPETEWFEKIQALAQSTLHPIRPDRFKRDELVIIDPLATDILPKQVETAAGRLGFLGGIELPMVPIGLELVDEAKKAVLLTATGLMTYNLETGEREYLMFDLASGVQLSEMAVSSDGRYAYVVSSEPSILRYDLTSGKRDSGFADIPIQRRDAHIAISPDGKTLATALFGKINLYNPDTGDHLGETRGNLNSLIYGMSFSPDGKTVFSHGNDPRIKYASLSGQKTGERRIVEKGNVYVYRLITRDDGIQLACGKGALTVWKGNQDKPKFQVVLPAESSGKIEWADVTPDLAHVVSSRGIWKFDSGDLVARMHPDWNPRAMALTPDGQRMVLCRGKGLFVVPLALTHPDQMVSVRNSQSGRSNLSQKATTAATGSHEAPSTGNALVNQESGQALKAERFRQWVDASGKYKIRAKLVGSTSETISLEKPDGTVVEVEIGKLGANDRNYLSRRNIN